MPQPCWHDIYPATTSVEDAAAIIRLDSSLNVVSQNADAKFGKICWETQASSREHGCLFRSANDGSIVASFPESPFRSGPLTFADAVNLFGTPTGIQVCRDMTNEHQLFIALYFQGAILASGKPFDLSQLTDRISLNTPIDEIDYHFKPTSQMSVWRGFAPITEIRYC
jgi:hypothetical protein